MRYCNSCGKLTQGEPLFCSSCGCTYEAKLCGSRHINPRTARFCATCGSTDLSTPHRKMAFWVRPLLYLLSLLPGVLLILLTIMLVVGMVQAVFTNQQILGQLFCMGLVLSVLWLAYMQLPSSLRKALSKIIHRKKANASKDHGHS